MFEMKDLTSWQFFVLPLFVLLLIQSCNDPTTFGADLLEDDRTQLSFFDTLTMEAAMEPGEPVLITSTLNSYPAYLFGKMSDPVFGISKAEIFMQLQPREGDIPFLEDGFIIDSVVLALPYSSDYFYGQTVSTFDLAVRRMTEVVSSDENYLSDTTFASNDIPLATASYRPRYDSISYINYYGSSVGDTAQSNMLRIPLSSRLGGEIFDLDSATLVNEQAFLEAFPGIHLQPTSTKQGIVAFDIDNPLTGIYIYYHVDDLYFQYQLRINTGILRYSALNNDISETVIGDVLAGNTPPEVENVFFTQGMSGPLFKIDFPHLDQLQNRNVIINKAELEMRIGSLPGDSSFIFPPAEQLVLTYRNEEGQQVLVDDVIVAATNLQDQFGGQVIEMPGEPDIYRMNFGTYLQQAIDGLVPPSVSVAVALKGYNAERTIIYGPKHPEYPIQLRVTGTVLDN
jgi:hypothetical protein